MKKHPQKTETRLVVLLDMHAILHRGYHAIPDFRSSSGEPTGALYGLAMFLLRVIQELKPYAIVGCYDLPGPTFRHESYEGYKKDRPKAEDDLISQLVRSREILRAFSIPFYEHPGFEADDIIGTACEQLRAFPDVRVAIASGDSDTMQLVEGDRVSVYTLKKSFQETQLLNEDAVAEKFGFGPSYLPDYKGLAGDTSDNIIGIAGIGEKSATQLIQGFGHIEEMYEQLEKDPSSFEKKGIKARTIKLLSEGKDEALFSKTLATIRRDAPVAIELPVKPWGETFDAASGVGIFREFSFNSLVPRLLALQSGESEVLPEISDKELHELSIGLWLIDSRKSDPGLPEILDFGGTRKVADARKKIESVIERDGLSRVYQEIELPIVSILADAEKRGILVDREYLDGLSQEYHREIDRLQARAWEEAGGEFNINSPKQIGEVLFERLGLSVKGLKKTAGGARSTRVTELEKLRGLHPVVETIMAYREYQKLLSTYIDAIPPLLDAQSRLHTHFVQAGTTTGRVSSRDPNLQNIPVKNELGMRIRRAFIASPGYVFAAFDYSQIELRVAAFLSGEEGMLSVFRSGGDIHEAVAMQVFGVEKSGVTKEMRRRAKVINFGILYGMGVTALKDNLGVERREAQDFYDRYFTEYADLAAYMESIKKEAYDKGFTVTQFGRRRYFPELHSKLPFVRAQAERMAINAPMQGTAADVIKLAIGVADKALKKEGLKDDALLLLQVHDELVFEVKKDQLEKVVPIIRKAMETAVDFSVPMVVNSKIGSNWADLE